MLEEIQFDRQRAAVCAPLYPSGLRTEALPNGFTLYAQSTSWPAQPHGLHPGRSRLRQFFGHILL